jgi:predicted  nucleic acid-binding Zn-ribbon protein
VKIQKQQLETLLEVQELILSNRKLELLATSVKESLLDDDLRSQMLSISSELNAKRTAHEELERDLRRLTEEQQLISKREEQDRARLSTTAVARDALGLQHELEALAKRAQNLSEQTQALREELARSASEQAALQGKRDELEEASSSERERAKAELADLKAEHLSNREKIAALKIAMDEDLLAYFEKRTERGLAIGRLRSNSCGACNMNLNAAAMTTLHNIPGDQLSTCPECQAILIR